MSFLDKFKKKAEKSQHKQSQKVGSAKQSEKKDLTVAELQAKAKSGQAGAKNATGKKTGPVAKGDTKMAYKFLIKPMVTEKGTYLASENKYLFEVDSSANKVEIKKAIQAVYGVWPIKVNIVNLSGKKVRYGRVRGRTKDRKKAIVTLKQGDKIEIYEGV